MGKTALHEGDDMSRKAQLTVVVTTLVCLWTASTAPAQMGGHEDLGVIPLIPREALFFIERRGHEAVGEAFAASNLGQVARDDALKQFVHDSCARIGESIITQWLGLDDPEQIDRHVALLTEALQPFWYRPCALFAMCQADDEEPYLGAVCLTGKFRLQCRDAIEALMAALAAGGDWQKFTHTSGAVEWHGVVEMDSPLPSDPGERAKVIDDQSAILVSWNGQLLSLASSVHVADAVSRVQSATGEAKASNESLNTVLGKTMMKDWAFRWHLDVQRLVETFSDDDEEEPAGILGIFGLDRIRGVGGTEGYADNVYTRPTYVDAPHADAGLTKVLKLGGSYKRALTFTPRDAMFRLAGELDTGEILKIISGLIHGGHTDMELPADSDAAARLGHIRALIQACDGSAAVFMTNLQMFAMGGMAAPPVALVFGTKRSADAAEALDKLIARDRAEDEETDEARKDSQYRGARIRTYPDGSVSFSTVAVMDDRIVLAMSDQVAKAAIDTAIDNMGGLAPNGKAEQLAKLAGDGSAIVVVDVPALIKQFWPFLTMMAMPAPEDFPLASVPSALKMASLLDPEIAVFRPDAGGVRIEGRGKLPLATKCVPLFFGFMATMTW